MYPTRECVEGIWICRIYESIKHATCLCFCNWQAVIFVSFANCNNRKLKRDLFIIYVLTPCELSILLFKIKTSNPLTLARFYDKSIQFTCSHHTKTGSGTTIHENLSLLHGTNQVLPRVHSWWAPRDLFNCDWAVDELRLSSLWNCQINIFMRKLIIFILRGFRSGWSTM